MVQQCLNNCQAEEPVDSRASPPFAGLYFSAEYQLVQPRTGPQDVAIATVRPGLPGGTVESVRWNIANGFRVGGGYRLPASEWDIGLLFTTFTARDKATLAAPPGGALLPTRSLLGATEEAGTAVGVSDLTYDTVDVEVGRSFCPCEFLRLRLFTGGRVALINHDFKSTYGGGTLGHGVDDVDSPVRFRGGGVELGGECLWKVGPLWGLFTRARVSAVYGRFTSPFTETGAGPAALAALGGAEDRLVPCVEAAAGLYFQGEHLFLSAGYDLTNWFEMNEPVDFLGAARPGHRESNLMLQGLSVKAGFCF
jgi:hypothetical protein